MDFFFLMKLVLDYPLDFRHSLYILMKVFEISSILFQQSLWIPKYFSLHGKISMGMSYIFVFIQNSLILINFRGSPRDENWLKILDFEMVAKRLLGIEALHHIYRN